jgi:O-antigen/teichoic acid export membrane protein
LLQEAPKPAAVAAVPLLVFAAPFLIMRNTLLGERQEGRRFQFVFMATLIAGFWSLMSGTMLVMALQACGLLVA